MLLLAPTEQAQSLSETNARLRFWLDSLARNPAPGEGWARVATPQQMAGLLSELMRAGQWLRALPSQDDPALAGELGEYRRNVERLRALMPSIHDTLLAERARLERERASVAAAAEWAHCSRQTL